MEIQSEINYGPTEVMNLHMADLEEVGRWNSVKDAMFASFDFAVRRDRYQQRISVMSDIPKGTISGLANGSPRALATHVKRPDLMNAMSCMYLHQFEADSLGCVSVRLHDYSEMRRLINSQQDEITHLKASLSKLGYTPISSAEERVSRENHGLFITGGEM